MRLQTMLVGGALCSLLIAPLVIAESLPTTQIPGTNPTPTEAPNNPLDMTRGQGAVPEQYAIAPVPEGQLKLEKGKQAEVKGQDGKLIGRLEQTIIDTKTGKPEYGVISMKDDQRLVPLPWSAFKFNREAGNATLNLSRPEMEPYLSAKENKDLSPSIQKLIKDMDTLRASGQKARGSADRPVLGDSHGEDKAGGAGQAAEQSGKSGFRDQGGK